MIRIFELTEKKNISSDSHTNNLYLIFDTKLRFAVLEAFSAKQIKLLDGREMTSL